MNIEKEKRAIEYLRAFQPQTEPYYLCYSGGKDSDTILTLAEVAGVNFEAVHNLTTVDAPETVNFIRSQPKIKINYPEISMWDLIVERKMPPTRLARYCCEVFKEQGGKSRVKITGVRWAESTNRKESAGVVKVIGKPKTMQKKATDMGVDYRVTKQQGLILNDDNAESRRFVEHCYRTTSTMVNPIVDWSDDDVLEFLCHYGIKINPLYEAESSKGKYICKGCKRIGCICCPLSGYEEMKADLIKYPKYRDNYLRAFDRMLKKRAALGLKTSDVWADARKVMMWWVGDNPLQISFFGEPTYLAGACM